MFRIIQRCSPLLSESAVFWLPTFDDDNKYPLMQSWREGGIVIASRATQADDSRKVQLPSISRLLSVPSAKDVRTCMYTKFQKSFDTIYLIFKRRRSQFLTRWRKKNFKYLLRFFLFFLNKFQFKFRPFNNNVSFCLWWNSISIIFVIKLINISLLEWCNSRLLPKPSIYLISSYNSKTVILNLWFLRFQRYK